MFQNPFWITDAVVCKYDDPIRYFIFYRFFDDEEMF